MNKIYRILFGIVLSLTLTTLATAGDFTVMTGPHAPFTVTKGLRINGISVDTLEVIMKMTNTPFDRKQIKLLPWKKAYARAKALPKQIMLNVPRTKELEFQFEWVGPVYLPKFVLIGKKDKEFAISSIADASKYKIGVIRGSDPSKELLAQGLDPAALKESTSYVQPLLQLKNGEVDLLAHSDMSATYLMKKMGMAKKDYKVVYTYDTIALYFAFSKGTDPARIKQLNSALATYKKPMSEWRSVFDKNTAKYLPNGVIE